MILLHSQPQEASEAMAVDHALLRAVASGEMDVALRFYEWKWPSVSLGRFQNIERTLRNSYTLSDVEWVRRITGGRAILHGDDLTITITSPLHRISEPGQHLSGAAATYHFFLPWFRAAFAALNVNVIAGEVSRITAGDSRGDCFDIISQADLVDENDGTKRLGAAIHITKNCFLLQASIPLRTPGKAWHQEALRSTLFCGAEKRERGHPLASEDLLGVLMTTWDSFSRSIGLDAVKPSSMADNLPESIAHEAQELRQAIYQDSTWTWRGQIPAGLIDSRERL